MADDWLTLLPLSPGLYSAAQAIRELKASTTWWKTIGRISGGATAIFLARRRRPPPGVLGSLGFGLLGTFIGEGLSLPFAILAGGRKAISSVEDPKHFAKVLQERQAMQNGRGGLPGIGPRMGQGQSQSQGQQGQQQGVLGRDLAGDKEFGTSGDFKDSSFGDFGAASSSTSSSTPRYPSSRQQTPSSPISSSSSSPSSSSSLPPPSFDVPPNSISDPFSPNPASAQGGSGSGSGGARRQGGSRWAELRGEAQSGESAWARLRRGEGPPGQQSQQPAQ
ncbi:hypothetical protein BCV69DRAFT_1203 [Microstroma glucosiphilum]|uniref:Uncharacterized protein n=1 Tax=Pseudomicrostroma glucosiphilum TaxID=1684307 RepID=A0A316UF08_9BASI|nr:hypothetical protein BCV69DRAFT_1203 [Pseudomicrostroma glucosiphilum]PWN23518.1 hypothetical protein BCV69DRAFT_1203 [Pseudomicrostroma glucosiphilum]